MQEGITFVGTDVHRASINVAMLRRGLSFEGKAWGHPHRRWMLMLPFDHAAAQATCDDYLRAVDGADDRLVSLDEKIKEVAASDEYREAVVVLRSFHGIDTLSAMVVLSDLGDITRFSTPRQLMAYLGVTPSECSSGGRVKRGGITKTGNNHLRRILVESSRHFRHRPRVSEQLRRRRAGQPAWAIAIGDKAHARLYRCQLRLRANGKKSTVVNVAVTRELAGFIWCALMTQQQRSAAR